VSRDESESAAKATLGSIYKLDPHFSPGREIVPYPLETNQREIVNDKLISLEV